VTKDEARFPLAEHRLDNGLRLVVQPDPTVPVVAVHVMYHVGSKNERPGKTGFAHLFEHLLFQGSQHVEGTEHMRLIQDAGGSMNGSTWFDRTNYYETLPSNRLDLALWLESDRMGFFLPSISRAKLDNQREVVKNERRQSYENRPYGLAVETVLGAMFPEGHRYRHPTIGYMEDLDAATLDDVTDFFLTWYGPANATVVVAGDVTVGEAVERVAHWFGEIDGRPPPPAPAVAPPAPGRIEVTIADDVSVPRVYLAFPAPSFTHPEFEAADVLTSLLAEGRSSRLYESLVYDRRVAANVSAYVWPTESIGLLWVVATARPGVGAPDLEQQIRRVLSELRAEGPTPRELAGARNRSRRQLVRQLDSAGRRADLIAHATVYRDDPSYVNGVFERYDSVGATQVAEMAERLLGPDDGTVLHVVPETSA